MKPARPLSLGAKTQSISSRQSIDKVACRFEGVSVLAVITVAIEDKGSPLGKLDP